MPRSTQLVGDRAELRVLYDSQAVDVADLLFFMFLNFTVMGSKNRNIEIGV